MPLGSSMRLGSCGWNAGRGGIVICCQSVAWAARWSCACDKIARSSQHRARITESEETRSSVHCRTSLGIGRLRRFR